MAAARNRELDSLTTTVALSRCWNGLQGGGEGRASFSWRRSGQILRLRDVEFARFPLIESLSRPDYTGSRGNKPLRGIALSAAGLFATESAVNTAGQNANYSAANLADRI